MNFPTYQCLLSNIVYLNREDFFKDVGEVADVRFAVDGDGNFRGFGHVEFSTIEVAQEVCLCFT